MDLPTRLDATLDLIAQRYDDALDVDDVREIARLRLAMERVGALRLVVGQLTAFEHELIDFVNH